MSAFIDAEGAAMRCRPRYVSRATAFAPRASAPPGAVADDRSSSRGSAWPQPILRLASPWASERTAVAETMPHGLYVDDQTVIRALKLSFGLAIEHAGAH